MRAQFWGGPWDGVLKDLPERLPIFRVAMPPDRSFIQSVGDPREFPTAVPLTKVGIYKYDGYDEEANHPDIPIYVWGGEE